jgi:hypothetical protein
MLSTRQLYRSNNQPASYAALTQFAPEPSTEALPIARAVQNAFASDPLTAVVWTDGVFRVTNYPLEILEAQIDDSDFAIAIAHPMIRPQTEERLGLGRETT